MSTKIKRNPLTAVVEQLRNRLDEQCCSQCGCHQPECSCIADMGQEIETLRKQVAEHVERQKEVDKARELYLAVRSAHAKYVAKTGPAPTSEELLKELFQEAGCAPIAVDDDIKYLCRTALGAAMKMSEALRDQPADSNGSATVLHALHKQLAISLAALDKATMVVGEPE